MSRATAAVRRSSGRADADPSKRSELHLVYPKSDGFVALTERTVVSFRKALLDWYDESRRDLPWRRTRDPYVIWVSEIMLQQTRVAAVLDHFRHFLGKFPTVYALASASESSVLAAWSGLGYYQRARRLHQCARQVVQELDGCFPQSAESLAALPGIGRYTAAAIASIAFGEPVAVVDGNVERVLARLRGSKLQTTLAWQRAQELISSARPGDFNQAMMELGATVCAPRTPNCADCAARKWCATRGELRLSAGAVPQQKKEIWHELDLRDFQANGTGRSQKAIRLVRRPFNASLMSGMWELPTLCPRQADSAKHPDYWRTFRHSITVTDYTVHVVRSDRKAKKPTRKSASAPHERWVPVRRVSQLPITGLTRKILKAGGII